MTQTRYLIQVFLDGEYVDGNLIWSEQEVKELFVSFEELLGGNYEIEEEFVEIEGREMYLFVLVARPSCASYVREREMFEVFPKPESHWRDHTVEIQLIHFTA